jgi:hypothetical protein
LNEAVAAAVLMSISTRPAPPGKLPSARAERQTMTRSPNGSRIPRLTRRRVLTVAATVGAGAATAGVAGVGLARETRTAADAGPLVVSLRDASTGTWDVFHGAKRVTVEDQDLMNRLLEAVANS